MNSEQKISNLFDALTVMAELPVMKLAQNGGLVKEIQGIMSSRNLWSIVDDIKYERNFERQAAFNNQQKSKMNPNSSEFLKLYSKYQSAAHNSIRESIPRNKINYTDIIDMKGVQAFNAKPVNPMVRKEIRSLPETKKFEEAFNSIFSDKALQIGTLQDPTQISSYIDYSPYIWNYQYYLSIPTLAQTIDLPNNIATRRTPNIIFEDHELSEIMEKHLSRMHFNGKVKKMLLYSDCSPRGSLIVPIEENGRVRFNVFNDTQFTYATSYQYSKIDFKDNQTGVSQLFVLGHLLQNEVTAHFLCPGFEPIFAIGKNRLFQLKDAAEAVNIYLYTIKVLCIRAQILVQTSDMAGQNDTLLAKLKQQTDNINSKLSLNTAINNPEGTTLDILNNNLSPGFAEVSPIIKEYQGMLSGAMPDYFYGSSTAYSANHFNLHVTHQNIHSQIQIDKIDPIYRFAINSILEKDVRFKKYADQVENYEIKHDSLYEPTEQERQDTDSKKIDNIIKMRDYPELEEIFKKEGLLRDEFTFSKLDHNNDRQPVNPEA